MKCSLLGSKGKHCLPLLPLLGLSIELFDRHCVNIVYYTQDWRSLLELFNSIMSGARHREEGRLRGHTVIYRLSTVSPAALVALPVWMLIAQMRRAGLVAGILRALGGIIAWVIIWFFLTFLGVMIRSMADHYERATDETNDSLYSNPYDTTPANPGEYYDPNEQQ